MEQDNADAAASTTRHLGIAHLPDTSAAAMFQRRNPSGLLFPVECDRLANERLECGFVNFFPFVDVDRAAYVPLETRVEETGRILERRALGEGQLHDILVGFARADDAFVRPDRGAGFGRFDPLPLLD